ncbi:hypothetical protein [Engelhardtia mirabilis]|uniref:hypothetical protein n=1 Tax=Engelhardtia mirabilis TaxID=2528011 RepID=UPI003AF37BC5
MDVGPDRVEVLSGDLPAIVVVCAVGITAGKPFDRELACSFGAERGTVHARRARLLVEGARSVVLRNASVRLE